MAMVSMLQVRNSSQKDAIVGWGCIQRVEQNSHSYCDSHVGSSDSAWRLCMPTGWVTMEAEGHVQGEQVCIDCMK